MILKVTDNQYGRLFCTNCGLHTSGKVWTRCAGLPV